MNAKDLNAFLQGSSKNISSLSPDSPRQDNPRGVAIIAAAAAGGIAYLIGPDALGIPRDGNSDEGAAAAVALFTYFVSRLVAPHLCSTKKEQKHIEAWNIARGAAAGVTVGIPIAIKIAADVAVTGGILTALGVLGAMGVWVYNRLNRAKYCQHCQHKDSCDHIVCRNPACLKLHFPMEKPLRCDEAISLTWYALASQLQNDGLNYFEALALVRKHFDEWTPHLDGNKEPTSIDCKQFSEWRDANKSVIASFRGTVTRPDPADIQLLEKTERDLKAARDA